MKNVILLLIILNFSVSAHINVEKNKIENSDFDLFLAWLPGEYDNFQQFVQDNGNNIISSHNRVRTLIVEVNYVHFNTPVYYIQQYADNDPEKIILQYLLSTEYLEKEKKIVMKKYEFPLNSAFRNIHLNQTKLNALLPKDLKIKEGCEIIWEKQGDSFIGASDPALCSLNGIKAGEKLKIKNYFELTSESFLYLENAYNMNDTLIYGRADNIPYKMNRVNYYNGGIYQKTNEKMELVTSFSINDVGDYISVEIDETEKTVYSFQLQRGGRSLSGKTVLLLNLFVKIDTTYSLESSVWADLDSKKIGIENKKILAEFEFNNNKRN